MKILITILILLSFLLAGCVDNKEFKRSYYQAKQCEKAGFDFKLSANNALYLSPIACVVDKK